MNKVIKSFLQNSGLEQPLFAPNSRYTALDAAEWTQPDGQKVLYITRRFIPKAENFATLQEHLVEEHDRLDNLAARYFSDPQLYWRLCDANGAMKPDALTDTVGNRLRITLPEGIPQPTDEF
jgi:hypothetical protein